MERKNILELLFLIAIVAVSFFFIGKYFGGGSVTDSNPGETITGYVPEEKLIPVKEETPVNSDLPMKEIQLEIQYRDTGSVKTETKYIAKIQVVDTAAIIADYVVKRSYSQTLFNNKFGKMEVFPTVYQNKLSGLEYQFKPKTQVWQPFVSTSYSTANYLGVGGGFFYHNLGVEYQYNLDLRRKPNFTMSVDNYFQRGNYHWFSGKYKF